MKSLLLCCSILVQLASHAAQAYDLPGYNKIVKCTEVFPDPDYRPYRFNASIFKKNDGTNLLAIVHRVNNWNNQGKNYKQDYVLSQVVINNPKTTTYWNESKTILMDDVQPYRSNKSILYIKGEPGGSRWMKCYDIGNSLLNE